MRHEYDVHTDVLETIVAATPATKKHSALLTAFATRTEFRGARYVTSSDEYCSRPARILNSDGDEIAADYRVWVQRQLDEHRGNIDALCASNRGKGYLLTEIQPVLHYFVHDRGGAQDNFVQIEVWEEVEFCERELFARRAPNWGRPSLQELRDGRPDMGLEERFDRRDLGAARYRLESAIDMQAFVAVAESLYSERHRKDGDIRVRVTDAVTGEESVTSVRDLTPGYDQLRVRERRIFDDWTASSAGRSGERICMRWVFQTSDWPDEKGVRWVSFVPRWAHKKNIAALKNTGKLDAYGLYGRLTQFDSRIGMPFAWYFYGLHGNRVRDAHLERVVEAAEEGLIVLPENDYRVLRRWRDVPYGF
ncbi:hypothetical protein SGO26_30185 (plasmid) [Cupriavidus metallidurans]|uniref:hypothetical protein n=1 Tax=Cupriavidus metallidurans TaxID=119219 RepID=UPI003D74B18D